VLADIGVDTSYMLEQNYLLRQHSAHELVRGVKAWMERGIFSFLADAGVLEHLQEFVESSHAPFAEIFTRQIISGEHTPIAHGCRLIHEACQTEAGRAEISVASSSELIADRHCGRLSAGASVRTRAASDFRA